MLDRGSVDDQCGSDGLDMVVPDNLNSWPRSSNILKPHDVASAKWIFARAHQADPAIAQKNALELASSAATIGLDWTWL